MDLLTPLRFLRALPSIKGRKRYLRAYRSHLWHYLSKRPHAKLLSCKLDGELLMKVSTADQVISKSVFIDGTFEHAELEFIKRVISPGMTAFDIGANIGVHTLTISQSIGPTGMLHAFEPSAAFERLSENVALNRFESRTRLNNVAIGANNGSIRLMRCRPGFEAFTSRAMPMDINFADGTSFEVPMLSVDSYARNHKIEQIDFMKIDTEGAELDVLKGAAEMLADRAIRYIMFEINEICLANCGSSASEIVAYLREAGFVLQILGEDGALAPCPDSPSGIWTTVVACLAHR